jgi:nucleoside-diphosphate-sugar epimerase
MNSNRISMTSSILLPQTLEELLDDDLTSIGQKLAVEFSQLAGKRLLITGGAGFLGYYLVQSVLHYNSTIGNAIDVTVYDNFVRGYPAWLENLEGSPNLKLVKHDISLPLPQAEPFDYIIHAAGIASPTYYRQYPLETIDANINGLRYLLEECRSRQSSSRPVLGLLNYSSSEIYGDPAADQIPTHEDYRGNVSCTGPRACYDESKRFGETLCVTYARQYGVAVKSARPFNNYGPGLKITDRRVLPDFARDVLCGRDITLLSDGSPKRTFCYISDAVTGYFKILVRGRPGEAYNVGVETPEISVAELADKVVECARGLFDYGGQVRRAASGEPDYLVDNPVRRCPDLTKARTELGYDPTVDFDDGLRRSLIWYYYNQDGADA